MPQPPRRAQDLLKPDLRVNSVLDIDLELLKEKGVRGLIFDLDDTLVCSLEPQAGPDVCSWIEEIREDFRIYIVSNNSSHQRVQIAATHLSIESIARAAKPSRRFFRQALQAMALDPHEVAIVGDQLFTDVLGGNRLGAMTILVDPLSAERKWVRKMMRRVEQRMLKRHEYHPPRVRHASIGPTGQPHHAETTPPIVPHHPSMEPGTHHPHP